MTDSVPATTPRLIWRTARFELGTPLPPEADDTAVAAPPSPIRPERRAIASIHGLLVILTVLLLLVILALAQGLIVPIVLAGFFATCLSPLVAMLSRVLWRGLAAALVVMLVIALLYLAIMVLVGPAQEWVTRLPESIQQINLRLHELVRRLGAGSGALMQFDSSELTARISLWTALSATPPILTKMFSVILLTYFFLVYGDQMLRRLVELSPSLSHKKRAVAIVRAIQSDTTRYLFITTLVNSLLGLVTATMLMLYGFPDPWLFGALAAIANFVPYVGSASVAILLALVGITSDAAHPGLALLPAATFVMITAVEGNLISPAIMGQRLSLSPVAILLWLMIWGWLWGLPGVLLGVPMLMCLKIVAERIDGARWFARAIE